MTTLVAAASTPSVPDTTLAVVGLSPEERMLALIVYSQASQMSDAKTSINLNAEQLEKLREQVKKALEEAREAKKDSGFWGGLAKLFGSDLASIASAVAAVAAVIATGGAAAAILAVVAAAAAFAADHAKELGIPVEVAVAIAITASVAGLCCGDAKGLFKVSTAVAETAQDVKDYATLSALALEADGAACGMVAASYDHTAAYAHADAREAGGKQELVSVDMDEAFDRLSSALERQNGAIELTSRIQQAGAASNYAILNNWGGAA